MRMILPMLRHPFPAPWRVAAAAALFASAGVVVEVAPHAPAAVWAEARTGLGGAVLALWVGPARMRAAIGATPAARILGAGVSMALFQWLFFAAVSGAGAVAAAWIAGAAAPMAAACWQLWASRSRPQWTHAIAAALFATGLAIDPHDPAGVLAGIAAGIAYSAYTVNAREAGGLASTSVALLCAALALLPAFPVADATVFFDARGLAACAYLALAATAAAYCLYVSGLREVSAAAALAILLLQPVAAMILGAAFSASVFHAPGACAALLFLAAALAAARHPPSKGACP